MTEFTLHTIETAPEKSKSQLEKAQKGFGFVPNLYAVMSEAPAVLEAYKSLSDLFGKTSFDNTERTVVWQVINVEHNCHYCVPAHTAIAKGQGVRDDVIDALRNDTDIPDARLQALKVFTLKVVRNRGNVSNEDTEAFLNAGYTKQNILEVILGAAQKTISNYVNHFAETPVDEPFKPFAWSPNASKTAAE